jgi:pyridoxal phosphate enzyme (YggS family)
MESLSGNIDAVRRRISGACAVAGRSPGDVCLVAVTKTVPVEAIRMARLAGLDQFGENRVQEAASKVSEVGREGLTWHLIGHLQSNKAGRAVELFDMIQSIDSAELAGQVARRAAALGKRQRVLLQVNASAEASKSGCEPESVPAVVRAIESLSDLDLRGFMTIGPLDPDPESARPAFRLLKSLRDGAEQAAGRAFPELSMGMSGDLEVAIEEGATIVRVGSAIFGSRG